MSKKVYLCKWGWPQDVHGNLTLLNDKTKKFRTHIIEARNKLLAHMDKEVHLTDKVLGGFPKGEEESFLHKEVRSKFE